MGDWLACHMSHSQILICTGMRRREVEKRRVMPSGKKRHRVFESHTSTQLRSHKRRVRFSLWSGVDPQGFVKLSAQLRMKWWVGWLDCDNKQRKY